MSIDASDILQVTRSVTKEWTRQRKAEERGRRSRESRAYVYSDRVNHTEVAHEILPAAYLHASGGGRHVVKKRQLFYAARKRFQQLTGRDITATYFSQNLLRKYLNTHPETESWKIAADARGHLIIPNAGHEISIPIGTLEIDEHLRKAQRECDASDVEAEVNVEWPSIAAAQRYQAVVYIEKEGFAPLLEEARIAERFDIGILSGKGQSTAAARRFVDEMCRVDGGVPLFILRDFDKAGFQIAKRLTTVGAWAESNDMVLYEFQNEINVTDLGLRLDDVNQYDLHWAAEKAPCSRRRRCKCFQCQPLDQDEYGVTDEEYEFLASGQRVELNALTSPQFIELIEAKLTEHGLDKRLIPDDQTLAKAYRRALAVARVNTVIESARNEAIEMYSDVPVPKTLRRQLQKAMSGSLEAWDRALYRLAQTKVTGPDGD